MPPPPPPVPPAIQLVSFDLHGTLVDTAAEIAEAVNRALRDNHQAPRSLAEITVLIGGGLHELMRRLLPDLPAPALEALLASADHHYAAIVGTLAPPYPGCLQALEALRVAGVRLACVTNKEAAHAERVLAATGLRGQFEHVIGGGSLPWKKPDARVLRSLVDELQVPLDHIVHVGDSAIDIAAARNAGVAGWAVPYGYNAGRPIEESLPDCLLPDLPAVAAEVLAVNRRAASGTPDPRAHATRGT